MPPLPELPSHQAPGPTPWSNWVIPGRVLAGAYPASLDDLETEQLLSLLLELGVTTFVCLQAEVNIHIPEHSWRAGVGLRPYIRDAQRLLSRAQETGSTRISQRKIDFLHLPIIDGSVTTDSAMSRLADDCCERVLRGEVMYIHCWGGHGRTGTLVAVVLGRLYDLPTSTALRLTQSYHDQRVYPQGVRSPQTTVQRAQVKRLLLLPNSFAGAAKNSNAIQSTATHSSSSSSRAKQQTSPGSPLAPRLAAAAAAAAAFTPGTPAKQSVVPSALGRLSARTTSSSAAAVPSAAGGSSAARNINFSHSLPRTAGSATAAHAGGGCSSSLQARLLQHQQSTPSSAGGSGGIGHSSSSSRQTWSAAAAAGNINSSSSRVQTATSPLLRSEVLRTPIQARLVQQPVSHNSPIRRQLVVDGTA